MGEPFPKFSPIFSLLQMVPKLPKPMPRGEVDIIHRTTKATTLLAHIAYRLKTWRWSFRPFMPASPDNFLYQNPITVLFGSFYVWSLLPLLLFWLLESLHPGKSRHSQPQFRGPFSKFFLLLVHHALELISLLVNGHFFPSWVPSSPGIPSRPFLPIFQDWFFPARLAVSSAPKDPLEKQRLWWLSCPCFPPI